MGSGGFTARGFHRSRGSFPPTPVGGGLGNRRQTELATDTEEILRRILDAFRLKVAYNRHTNHAECEVVLSAETFDAALSGQRRGCSRQAPPFP